MSAATKIPPELFEDILWYVCRRDQDAEWVVVGDDRRNVSSCGRVCRHWALPCRLKLFGKVTLRSAEDAQELKAMLDSDPPSPTMPPLCNIIRAVQIDARNDARPWLHLVRLTIIPRLRESSAEIVLAVDGSHSGESRVIGNNQTDFYGLVPRSLPSMAPVLTSLCLTSVHFTNRAELCLLLGSYPMLKLIGLCELTWTTPPVWDDFLFLQLGPGAFCIETECGNDQDLPTVWFLPALIARTEKPVRFRPQQALQSTPRLHLEDYKSLVVLLGVLRRQEGPATVDGQMQYWGIQRE